MQPTTPRDFLKVALQRLTAAEEIMDKFYLSVVGQGELQEIQGAWSANHRLIFWLVQVHFLNGWA